MAQFIKHISATGLHGRFDLALDFEDGVNIVYGRNGSGKTTLLHILANAVNLDLLRFVNLRFKEISLQLSDSSEIKIMRESESSNIKLLFNVPLQDEVLLELDELDRHSDTRESSYRELNVKVLRLREEKLTAVPTYFPAFRTMIEAWSSVEDDGPTGHRGEIRARVRFNRPRQGSSTSMLARRLFGEFVPSLNYPSPREIETQINGEIQQAVFRVAQTDRSLLSSVFTEAFAAISGSSADGPDPSDTDSILEQIKNLSGDLQHAPIRPQENVYEQLIEYIPSFTPQEQNLTTRRVLAIYVRILNRMLDVRRDAFEAVNEYIEAVNNFLEDKQLVIGDREQSVLGVKFSDGRISGLTTLSSGERQIIGLIYAASHIGKANIILIDEPELSLHVDWQRKLIDEMVSQLPAKQLIVCTHSPIIGAAFQDNMIELRPSVSPVIYEEENLYLDDDEAYHDIDFEEIEEIF